MTRTRGAFVGGLLLLLTLAPIGDALAQTQVKPGFNVFSVNQDIEIGRQSAAQAERQLPVLRDRNVEAYVDGILRQLVAVAPGPKFPYDIEVVNASDVNAFALPGGFLYINRGLITTARTEGQLAGVMAHEIAHIALRHGTHNASKAYMARAGLGVLGGILGRGQARSTQSIINAVGGLGLNTVFLKFSRDAETQADIVGAQMMARAGFDPMEMVSFFELLQSKQRGGGVAQFLSDHPAPANRAARVRQEVQAMGAVRQVRNNSRELQRIQALLRGMGPARSLGQIARGDTGTTSGKKGRQTSDGRYPTDDRYPSDSRYPSDDRAATDRVGSVRVEPPSNRFVTYRQRDDYFRIDVPENWQAHEAENGFGVTFVPEGGAVQLSNGEEALVYGVIVNHYDPFEGGSARRRIDLSQATDDLVAQIRRTNAHLRVTSRARSQRLAGDAGLSLVLAGTSPVTGEEERVTVFTRDTGDGHVVYTLFVAPGRDYDAMSRTYTRMVQSLTVNNSVAHR